MELGCAGPRSRALSSQDAGESALTPGNEGRGRAWDFPFSSRPCSERGKQPCLSHFIWKERVIYGVPSVVNSRKGVEYQTRELRAAGKPGRFMGVYLVPGTTMEVVPLVLWNSHDYFLLSTYVCMLYWDNNFVARRVRSCSDWELIEARRQECRGHTPYLVSGHLLPPPFLASASSSTSILKQLRPCSSVSKTHGFQMFFLVCSDHW